MEVKLVVGMEIHVQLATATKIFCGCKVGYEDLPNTNVCPVCLGLPGALPVMNKKAYEYSVRTAMALNCQIPSFTKWDRKCYYYPDLPKGYQISQYDLPMSENGTIEVADVNGKQKSIRILRAHLEEDAGKNMHDGTRHSQVDLNRAGTPLLEIVTEPDLRSATECKNLATELQKIVQFLGVSEANMQKGQIRFEPNINLIITEDGQTYKTPIIEVKNLNSFRAIEGAVEYESWRQLEAWKKDHNYTMEKCGKENRGWDANKNETVFQRGKEDAHDYRYFPDPDLVPVEIDDAWKASIRETVTELPRSYQERFITQYKLSAYDAAVLTGDKITAQFLDDAVKAGASPKRTANIITQFGLKVANEKECTLDQIGVSVTQITELAKIIDDGLISASASQTVFEKMLNSDQSAQAIAKENNLVQNSDSGALEDLLDAILATNNESVEKIKRGDKMAKKLRGFLMGEAMKQTKGQANPQVLNKLLSEKLK